MEHLFDVFRSQENDHVYKTAVIMGETMPKKEEIKQLENAEGLFFFFPPGNILLSSYGLEKNITKTRKLKGRYAYNIYIEIQIYSSLNV